jgi:hypothetical protein
MAIKIVLIVMDNRHGFSRAVDGLRKQRGNGSLLA